jgi:hypothetical protein
MDIPNLLPLAFYALTTKDWKSKPSAEQALRQLPIQDQIRLQAGRFELRDVTMLHCNTFYDQPACGKSISDEVPPLTLITQNNLNPRRIVPTCKGVTISKDDMYEMLKDPLMALHRQITVPRNNLCPACRAHFIGLSRAAQVAIYEQLKSIFDL